MSTDPTHQALDPLAATLEEKGAEPASVPATDQDLVGTRLGPYLVCRKIGEGGMGAVYEGLHEGIGRRVAIKVLHGRLQGDTRTSQRFRKEAVAIHLVRHPGLVDIQDHQQLPDGRPYLVMEYLEGESLEQRLERLRVQGARLPIETVRQIGWQVASALEAAHAREVVHCDLKPDNIYLMRDPAVPGGERVKVLDFGIAKILAVADGEASRLTTTAGMILGTPRYMSPEQCEGRDKVDSSVDVYALGVILYELLAGAPPFEAETASALMRQHMVREPPPLRERAPVADEALCRLVHDMLAKQGARRPTMAQVRARLEAPGMPVRRPGRLALAAALLLLLLGGSALLLVRLAAPRPVPAAARAAPIDPVPPVPPAPPPLTAVVARSGGSATTAPPAPAPPTRRRAKKVPLRREETPDAGPASTVLKPVRF